MIAPRLVTPIEQHALETISMTYTEILAARQALEAIAEGPPRISKIKGNTISHPGTKRLPFQVAKRFARRLKVLDRHFRTYGLEVRGEQKNWKVEPADPTEASEFRMNRQAAILALGDQSVDVAIEPVTTAELEAVLPDANPRDLADLGPLWIDADDDQGRDE